MQRATLVMQTALKRKTHSSSATPEPVRQVIRQAQHNERYRRKKLQQFQEFLDLLEASGYADQYQKTIISGLRHIYEKRFKTPFDMSMWLLHETEIIRRGLEDYLPCTSVK